MYYCNDCKHFVKGETWEQKTPDHKMEKNETGGTAFYQEVRCEQCGSTDIDKAKKCLYCGDPTTEDFCEWCMDEAKSVVRWFIRGLETKSLERIDLLQEACEKVWYETREEINGRI